MYRQMKILHHEVTFIMSLGNYHFMTTVFAILNLLPQNDKFEK